MREAHCAVSTSSRGPEPAEGQRGTKIYGAVEAIRRPASARKGEARAKDAKHAKAGQRSRNLGVHCALCANLSASIGQGEDSPKMPRQGAHLQTANARRESACASAERLMHGGRSLDCSTRDHGNLAMDCQMPKNGHMDPVSFLLRNVEGPRRKPNEKRHKV